MPFCLELVFIHLKEIPVYALVQSHQVKPPPSVWQKALLTATGSERCLGLVDCGFSTWVALLAASVLCTPVRVGPKLEADCSHQAKVCLDTGLESHPLLQKQLGAFLFNCHADHLSNIFLRGRTGDIFLINRNAFLRHPALLCLFFLYSGVPYSASMSVFVRIIFLGLREALGGLLVSTLPEKNSYFELKHQAGRSSEGSEEC